MSRIRTLFAALLVLMTFGAQAQDEAELHHIQIFASFIPNVQFSPLYVAIEEGFFAQGGLSVEVVHGDENIGVMQVAQGEPPFGVISGEQVILARSSGIPVQFFYTWFQDFPVAVVAPDTVTLAAPEDLAGLRVGLPGPFGASYSALIALLSLAGLTESDIDMQSIGYAAPDVVCLGGVDAAIVYSNNEPLEIQRRIDAGQCGDITGLNIIYVSDFVSIASNGLVASEATLAARPDDARAVAFGFDRGAFRSITNPAQAYLHSLKYVENLPQSPEFVAALEIAAGEFDAFMETQPTPEELAAKRAEVRAAFGEQFPAAELAQYDVLQATVELWGYPQLGIISETAWINTRDVMAQMGQVDATFDISDAYITEFIPVSADDEGAPSN